jgi:hypothetical protein
MSLREELKAIHDQFSGIGDDELLMWDEIINKVLDAAVEAVDQMYKDIVFHQDHVYLARCRTKKDAIEAINKLRRD